MFITSESLFAGKGFSYTNRDSMVDIMITYLTISNCCFNFTVVKSVDYVNTR